jgi:hypothetical protein
VDEVINAIGNIPSNSPDWERENTRMAKAPRKIAAERKPLTLKNGKAPLRRVLNADGDCREHEERDAAEKPLMQYEKYAVWSRRAVSAGWQPRGVPAGEAAFPRNRRHPLAAAHRHERL